WLELQKRCSDQESILAVEKALWMAQLWTDLDIPYGFDDFSKWPQPSKEETRNLSSRINYNTIDQLKLTFPYDASFTEKIRIIFRIIFPAPAHMGIENNSLKIIQLPILY